MGNRLKINGTWHDIDNLGVYPLSRVHSIEYEPDGCVYQIAFGSTVLELTIGEAIRLGTILYEGVEEVYQ